MKIRTKIFLGYLLIIVLGFYSLQDWIIEDVRKNYVESAEEMMVDTSNILASMAEQNIHDKHLDITTFDKAFKKAYARKINAKIYELRKDQLDMQVYITDEQGVVLYDSKVPEKIGLDFSTWRDVSLTLKGKYGARSTRVDQDDPHSSILYVAAPIYNNDKLFGVLTVGKPVAFTDRFIETAKKKIVYQTIIAAIIVILLSMFISMWLTRPIKQLRDYAKDVRDGKRTVVPEHKGNNEIAQLTLAFEQMREALEGKKYVEEYVNNMTHELKSPLSAITGAIELLDENNLPAEQKKRFSANIKTETERMRNIVDKMLQLSTLENCRDIATTTEFDLVELIAELGRSYECLGTSKQVMIQTELDSLYLTGDRLLIYQAIDNLISNAVDFIPQDNGLVVISLALNNLQIEITVSDNGPGIPDYAVNRIFEKFYSLPRPETNRKSSGLGLSLVKEIVVLHSGSISLTNREDGGCEAIIRFPGAE